ncbi:riboflavin synthase alpha chain [Tumebacillus sp. BK434]|uniref:riboflavin synthase n=1 Tax=Tumebacillus sp. BK434 TaxID=2512169 RepID=UPI0010433CAA|nr:riboflavin synthase [Tumebacillus sp. BK434]TCP59531.1 riboflavin synthase alpha chain [Tumebacillus sp. BK434]
MFTGLIEEVGTVQEIRTSGKAIHLKLRAASILEDVALGDSIAVNGICLTVTHFDGGSFTVDVVPETMRRTTLHELAVGSPVNLERAMAMGKRFGGHIVSGHVDGIGRIAEIVEEDIAKVVRFHAPPEVLRYLVEKGSITIDGVSLTVMDVASDSFRVSVIPHTWQVTVLRHRRVGSVVNLECDIIGKYVERLLLPYAPGEAKGKSNLTLDYLRENGFA